MKLNSNLINIIVKYVGNDCDIDYKIDIYDRIIKNANKKNRKKYNQLLCENPSISYRLLKLSNEDNLEKYLINNQNIPLSFLKKKIKNCWNSLALNQNIKEEFYLSLDRKILKNKINLQNLLNKKNLSFNVFEKIIDINTGNENWPFICLNPNIPESFFEKYLNIPFTKKKINWYYLSQNIGMSESFFEKYINFVDWYCLSKNTNISESFFLKYLSQPHVYTHVCWPSLCQNLSEKFFEKYPNKITWYYLCLNTNISESFFEKYISDPITTSNIDWRNLCQNTNLSEKFFEKYIKNVDWYFLSKNTNISESFFQKHLSFINPFELYTNPNISLSFIDKLITSNKVRDMGWQHISSFLNITLDFISKHFTNLSKSCLLKNPTIPLIYQTKALTNLLLEIL